MVMKIRPTSTSKHLHQAIGVVSTSNGFQADKGDLTSALVVLMSHQPDLFLQALGRLDLKKAHGRVQLDHIHPDRHAFVDLISYMIKSDGVIQ